MTAKESPRELYERLERRLTPLLRSALERSLPRIDPDGWWETCVLPALTPVQRDHLTAEKSLRQFDYSALVSIAYRNHRNLRRVLGVGDELTNYLFTVKTFRNDVAHTPGLVVDEARRSHVEQAAELAERILRRAGAAPASPAPRPAAFPRKAAVLGLLAIAIAGAGFFLFSSSDEPSGNAQVKRLADVGEWMNEPQDRACIRYRRKDGTWSKRYTVRAAVEKGKALNEASGRQDFADDANLLVVHWKKSDEYSIILLPAGDPAIPRDEYLTRDSRNREWAVRSGWEACRKP